MFHAHAFTTLRWLMVPIAMLAWAAPGRAQEAAVNGTVTDMTGGVLPGVTVTALHNATGNSFVGVTDERGVYRIPVRVGIYRLTLDLAGLLRRPDRRGAARADRLTQPPDGNSGRAGIGEGDR